MTGGICHWRVVLLTVIAIRANAQKEDAAASLNIKHFQEIYGLATQLMNIGGNILNNAQPNGQPSTKSIRDGGNGVLSEVRPQLRGVSSYDGLSSGAEYGGGPLGSGSRSQPRSILDTLMGSFLGSSLGSSPAPSPSATSSIFRPTYEEYGGQQSRFGGTRQGSNIDAIVDALSRTGAKRETPDSDTGWNAGSFLSQFFGGGRRR